MHFAKRRAMNAAVVATLAISAVCPAATLHVPADYPTIQACIDAAVSGVDECVVAPGTYHETINFLGKAITVRSSGGADVTTIDATGIGGSVVTCANSEGPDTVLDGFTITGGRGTDLYGNGYRRGGGMYNGHSSPTVTNCTFSANIANEGGGMYNNGGSPAVTACNFDMNVSIVGSGGGMSNYANSPTVTNCRFNRNRAAQGDGGGMYNFDSSPIVTNCTFSGNSVSYAGGGMFNYASNPALTNCTFSGNWADSGGGMANYHSSPAVTNSTFIRNTAKYEYGGGGMSNSDSNPTMTNCTFTGNTAAFFGGGMVNWGSSPTVTNCSFTANTALYDGGGMTNSDSGGGMYNSGGSPTLTNCILWGDSPDEIINANESAPTLRFSDVQGGLPVGAVDGGGNIDLDPMFVRPPNPGPDGTWDGVDDDYGDLRLRAGSPCIDAGDNAAVPADASDLDGDGDTTEPLPIDLSGSSRFVDDPLTTDTGSGAPPIVDMGAYEHALGGDCDPNGRLDLADFASLADCMAGPGSNATVECNCADIDLNGDVDLRDLAGFQRVFAGQ